MGGREQLMHGEMLRVGKKSSKVLPELARGRGAMEGDGSRGEPKRRLAEKQAGCGE
jgi:hypothetical protein